MMRCRYDFHLHSCLSPCGDEDMTPYNLVNLAALLELDMIALTDHNTVGNCESAMAAGAAIGLTVIPGMELCTAEEIHVICLFPALDKAKAFGEYVHARIPPVKNRPNIYGRQLFMDHEDKILGEEPLLLVTASSIPITEVPSLCAAYGGFCYPAHIDRASFSILASLGDITADMGFSCAELTPAADVAALTARHPDLAKLRILRSSDAHRLEDMREAADTLDVAENTPAGVMAALRLSS
jgi:PHP family Zn ribbon phosphoesterase